MQILHVISLKSKSVFQFVWVFSSGCVPARVSGWRVAVVACESLWVARPEEGWHCFDLMPLCQALYTSQSGCASSYLIKNWLFSNPFFLIFPRIPCTPLPPPHSVVNPPPGPSLLWHPRAIVAAGARPPRGTDGARHSFIQLRVTAYGWARREGMEETEKGGCCSPNRTELKLWYCITERL